MFKLIEKLRSVGARSDVVDQPPEIPATRRDLGPGRYFSAFLKRERTFDDASGPIPVEAVLERGWHELERLPNPYGSGNDWLVVRGTLTGASVDQWLQWTNSVFGEFEIRIRPAAIGYRESDDEIVVPSPMAFAVTAPGGPEPSDPEVTGPQLRPRPVVPAFMLDDEITIPGLRPERPTR